MASPTTPIPDTTPHMIPVKIMRVPRRSPLTAHHKAKGVNTSHTAPAIAAATAAPLMSR